MQQPALSQEEGVPPATTTATREAQEPPVVVLSIVLEGKPKLLSVSATHHPSVRADPQGMQPG
eukprot:COSAG06_NODE_6484_length_2914_cov_41.869272_3_plen_63_part_00